MSELLRLVATNGASEPSGKRGVGPAEARGHLLVAGGLSPKTVRVGLRRVLTPGAAPHDADALGVVIGSWHPDGPGSAPVAGCLAVLRPAADAAPELPDPR